MPTAFSFRDIRLRSFPVFSVMPDGELFQLVKLLSAFGRLDEEALHLIDVFFRKRVAEVLQLFCERVDLGEQDLLIEQKQLAPHRLIDLGDAGEIPEGIAGVFHQMRRCV